MEEEQKELKEEKQEQEEEVKEDITEDMDLDIIEKANEAALRLEKANRRHEQLIGKQMKMQAEMILGGRADANVAPPKDDSPEDYAKKVMANEVPEET